MKLKEYMEMREPGAEVTCWDKDIDGEFYFYNKEVGKKSLYGDDFPNVNKCDELLQELLDVVRIHDGGVVVNLYDLLNHPAVIQYAKENMFEEGQYEDDSDVVMMLFDDNVANFSNGFEGFSELMVECLLFAYKSEKNYDLGFGYLGNGMTVWNRLQEENGDYKKVAHISPEREVKYYDKYAPAVIRQKIEDYAATGTPVISATQDQQVFHVPPKKKPLEEKIASAEARKNEAPQDKSTERDDKGR